MKYLKLFENAPSIGNSLVRFDSKNEKLDCIKDQINLILSTMSDKILGFNYMTGSKGIYFTNKNNELVSDSGYGCTTYSELESNLECILYTLKQMNMKTVINNPIENLPIEIGHITGALADDTSLEVIQEEEPIIEKVKKFKKY